MGVFILSDIKNKPVIVAIATIFFITAGFYALKLMGVSVGYVGENPSIYVVTPSSPPSIANVYTVSGVAFTIGAKDAVAYLVNVPNISVVPPRKTPIESLGQIVKMNNYMRSDYMNYYLLESVSQYYPINIFYPPIQMFTYYPYILQNTKIEYSAYSSNQYMKYLVKVNITTPYNNDVWNYMSLNATEIGKGAFFSVALVNNFFEQGYMIGFYKDYLKYCYFSSMTIQYITFNTTIWTPEVDTFVIIFGGTGNVLSGTTIYVYPFLLFDETLSAFKSLIYSSIVESVSNSTTTYQIIVETNYNNYYPSSLSSSMETYSVISPTIQYLAKLYYMFEQYYGATAAEQVVINPSSSYPAGTYSITGYELQKEMVYSYKDYFFGSRTYYAYSAVLYDLLRGYYFAPSSIKPSFVYYFTLPPAYIPRTAYAFDKMIFYANTTNFGLTTSVTTSTYKVNKYTLLYYVTSSIYNTGELTGDITLRIPLQYGEYSKTLKIYLFQTNPDETYTTEIPLNFRTTSTDITVVFKDVTLGLSKPTAPIETFTFWVAMVITESVIKGYVPPISGTYVLVPEFATSTSTLHVQYIESVSGVEDTLYITVPVEKVYVTSFKTIPVNSTVTYTGDVSLILPTHVGYKGKTLTYGTTTIVTIVSGTPVTLTTVTGLYYVTGSNSIVVPTFTFETIQNESVEFNLQDYLKTLSEISYSTSSTITVNTYTTYSASFNGSDVVFSSGTGENTNPLYYVRNEFYTAASIEVTITYTTSTYTTVSVTTSISTSYSYGTYNGTYYSIPVYYIYYTTYYITTYITTIPNVVIAPASFLPSGTTTSITLQPYEFTNNLDSFVTTNLQSLLLAGDFLATKIYFRELGLNYAEANNYINVANIRNQWLIGDSNTIPIILTSYIFLTYTETVSLATTTTSIKIVTTIEIQNQAIIEYAMPLQNYNITALGMIFKNPYDAKDLFKSILYANYPIIPVSITYSYTPVVGIANFYRTYYTFTVYNSSPVTTNNIVGVMAFETYVPGLRVAIVRFSYSYTTDYYSIPFTVTLVSRQLVFYLYAPVIYIETYVVYTYEWYPPINFLVSTMPYGIAFPDEYTNIVFYFEVYSSTSYSSGVITPSTWTTELYETYVIQSISSTDTIYSTSYITVTSYIVTTFTTYTPVIESSMYAGIYPIYYVFFINLATKTTVKTEVQTLGENEYIYITRTMTVFEDKEVALPPLSTVSVFLLYSYKDTVKGTYLSSLAQVFPYPVNPFVTSVAYNIYGAWAGAVPSGTTSVTIAGKVYTFTFNYRFEPPWYAAIGELNRVYLYPQVAFPEYHAGMVCATYYSDSNGVTRFGFCTDSYTTYPYFFFYSTQYTYSMGIYGPFDEHKVFYYVPFYYVMNEYAEYVTTLNSTVTNLAWYPEYKYVTNYVFGYVITPGTPNSLTYSIILIKPGDPYPFTTIYWYKYVGLEQ